MSPSNRGLTRVSEVGEEGLDDPEGSGDSSPSTSDRGREGPSSAAGRATADDNETMVTSGEDVMMGTLPNQDGDDTTPDEGSPSRSR